MPPLLTHFGITFGVTLLVFVGLWVLSLRLRNASIVDIWWGPGFALIAGLTFWLTSDAPLPRRLLTTTLTVVWGLRLGLHLFVRNAGKGEDFRYVLMRRRFGDRFPLVSLATVFGLQAVLMWIVSVPVQAAQRGLWPPSLGAWDLIGTLVWGLGFGFETIGDWQLARFKADPSSAGQVMDRGLWRYTRHPNYFGDACVWWGLFLIACATPRGWHSLPGPIMMTILLRRVSGVPMLEHGMQKRRPGYADYVARTSPFVPWWPRTR
jgi:steroid 5-alpha reductase family enzyme